MMLLAFSGLTVREVLADIPHDTAAVIVYVLVALFVGLTWYGSRNKGTPGGRRPSDRV